MKLTIGTATFDDHQGLYMTLQALRMYHPVEDVELLVVDNNPGGAHAKANIALMQHLAREHRGGAVYVQFPAPVGTAAPRDEVFRRASGDFVLCCDSHVLFFDDAIAALKSYLRANPGSKDILCGPMFYDGLNAWSTHFDDAVWRGEMWGVWASAWGCACGGMFQTREVDGAVVFAALLPNGRALQRCTGCNRPFPFSIPWNSHEKHLQAAGYTRLGKDPDLAPFPVPAQGLGAFCCSRSAWPGFNPSFRGFGGEECYVHEKARRHGQATLCCPWLQWVHRFGRPDGIRYPISVWNKARNYVIGLRELGAPLDPVFRTFPNIPEHEKRELLRDPVPEVPAGAASAAAGPARAASAEAMFQGLLHRDHDFRGHEEWMRSLASGARRVIELGGRRGSSTVCLLAGTPDEYVLIDPNPGAEWPTLSQLGLNVKHVPALSEDTAPQACELLLIDTAHHYDQLLRELRTHGRLADRILVHDTVLHAVNGEGGRLGLLPAVREWLQEQPERFVARHDPQRYGLTLLSRLEADRPKEPVRLWSDDPAKDGGGPGTELKAMLSSMHIDPGPSCDCNAKAAAMDAWGAEGCEANFNTIVGWLRDGMGRWGWKDKIAAAANALRTGLAFKVSWSDPFPDLVREAIRRARK